ncbi:flavodoxin [Rhizobium leguminosarum]|uniref:flavodoxin n=1 Tax=Rhizobium leguminosarum TaxID=384 RepID=UPI001C94344E
MQDFTSAASALVAFFSRTGNTRVIASQIRRAKEADLFEIVASAPYPEDYEATVAQASSKTSSGYRPPLTGRAANLSRYDTVYLGFPVWGMTAPPVIRSFLRSHDLTGKNVRPFVSDKLTPSGVGRVGRCIADRRFTNCELLCLRLALELETSI